MTIVIFGLSFTVLIVLAFGFILLRKWAQKQAELHLWTKHDRKLHDDNSGQSKESWRANKRMNMR